MTFPSPDGESRAFDFRGRPRAIVLDGEGVHHPATARGRGRAFTRYADITHVAVSPPCLWLGTRRSAYALSRGAFVDPLGPERVLRALLERIAEQPGGGAQLARINELDARGAETPPTTATLGLAGICIALFGLEILTRIPIFDAGYMSLALVRDGDLHRVVTANLIHAFGLHLVFNLLCLLAVGRMLERAIGSERVVCVMGASALGAMAASGWLREEAVVGVSGVVFGLAAGLLWVELRCAEALPAWWRFPRRALLWICGALVLDSVLGFVIPLVAGEAHLGGFAAGLVATALVTPRSLAPASLSVRRASRGVLGATALAVLTAAVMLAPPGEFRVRHALRVAQLPGIAPEELNNRAWLLATLPGASPDELAVALILAQRAVDETEHRDATILDTLAEVQFQLGNRESALAIIDEAIARKPDQDYYREQRRRFLGERARDDRPDPPLPDPPWDSPPDPEPADPRDGGITV
ncbi:MAG TPA: rhomboid family intramembrane serine protease [Myxococcota bacterium]